MKTWRAKLVWSDKKTHSARDTGRGAGNVSGVLPDHRFRRAVRQTHMGKPRFDGSVMERGRIQ